MPARNIKRISPRKASRFRAEVEMEKRLLAGRSKFWRPHATKGYDLPVKLFALRPFMEKLDERNLLGKVIIDAGSGSRAMIDADGYIRSGIFYPTAGKKIIRIDVASPYKFRETGSIADVRADIENLRPNVFWKKRSLVQLARFIGVNPRKKTPHVDTILLSDVLNYVDFRKTIAGLSAHLKPGGRVVIANMPDRGYEELFSLKGVKSNSDLVEFLQKTGFELEFLGGAAYSPVEFEEKGYPHIEQVAGNEFMLLVARKKSRRAT